VGTTGLTWVRDGRRLSAAPLGAAAASNESAVPGRSVALGLLAVTVVACALRLPFLGHQSLWFDEIYTRTIVGRHGLTAIWDQIKLTESTPPLYYLAAKLSTAIAGTRSAAAMRAPSALALTLAAPVSYFAFRRLIGQRAALASAGIVAVSPLLVSYSTDARSYGLLVLTALLSIWGFSAILAGGSSAAYLGWCGASVACVWTHYFGAFTVAGEASILFLALPERRRETTAWALLIVVCSLPLIPVLAHQNASEDSAYIAGIPLSTRLEQTVREFGMGANVPRAWLEAAGLLVIYAGLVGGVMLGVRRRGIQVLIALASFTVVLPLLIGVVGIEDRFYVRNVIVGVPLLGALAAPALLRFRAAPLALYLGLALIASIWVATNWRYEQADWRTAIASAGPLDRGVPVITYGAHSAGVAATYLQRSPTSLPIRARRVVLIVQPYRGPGDRGFVPAPLPPELSAGLRQFRPSKPVIVHGFQLIRLTAASPTATLLSPSQLPQAATVFSPTS
jgi:mannosyltransferase